jgi:hypothetical protein
MAAVTGAAIARSNAAAAPSAAALASKLRHTVIEHNLGPSAHFPKQSQTLVWDDLFVLLRVRM